MLYNAVFTSWPCIFTFVFERDVGFDYSMSVPSLYQAGHKKYYFNYGEFWKWILLALFHGCVAYFIPMYGMVGPNDSSGRTYEHWVVSTVSFSIILHVVTYKLFVDTYFWSRINILMASLSIFIYYIVVILGSVPFLANMIQAEASGVFFVMAANPRFWFMILIVPFICLLPDVTIVTIKRMFFKKPCDIIIHYEKMKRGSGAFRGLPIKPTAKQYEISEWLKPELDSKAKINDSEFFDLRASSMAGNGNYFDNTDGFNEANMKKQTGKFSLQPVE